MALSGSELVAAAKAIAVIAHRGQKDKTGQPYILHPYRVADSLSTPEEKAAGWLHDVIEDSDISNSVIGIRSYVAHGTRLNRVVMMGADYYAWSNIDEPHRAREGPATPGVGEGSYVENAIIDKNASIGRDCRITNEAGVQEGEGPGFYIRDGVVVVVKNGEIADGTVI